MFIVCSYLDVERKDHRTDGFVVEECGKFVPELDGCVIVCREHRENSVTEWARNNMESKYTLFEKQFAANKSKAMRFLATKGGIISYTLEMVEQAGGLDAFKEAYHLNHVPGIEVEVMTEEKPPMQEEEINSGFSTMDVGNVTFPEHPKDFIESISHEQKPPIEISTEETKTDREFQIFAEEIMGQSEIPTVARECKEEGPSIQFEAHHCPSNCIYNPDGTFKAFTEGQILNLLQHLKELDQRIALGSLNPEYVLTEEELLEADRLLDTISPSVFKAFLKFMTQNTATEMDRIRVSSVLDEFTAFFATWYK